MTLSLPGAECRPDVVGGQQDGDLIRWLALAEQVADAADVASDVGHDRVPGVVVVEDGGGVERPAGLTDLRGRVGPAVEDELVLAHDEVDVGLGLHVERGGAEDRGMQPGKGLAGGYIVAEDVVGGGGPAQGGEGAPLWPLAFGQGGEALAGEGDGGLAIGLRAELGAVGDGPVVDLGEVVFVDQFGEGLAPVVADVFGLGGASGYKLGKMGEEVVAATLFELGGEGGGPVGAVGFERVGEDGVRRGRAEGLEQRLADGFEVGGDGLMAEGIEYPAFGSHGGALDDLAGVSGDEEEGGAGAGCGGDMVGAGGRQSCGGGCVPVFGLTVDQRDGDDGFAVGQLEFGQGGRVGGEGDLSDAETASGFLEGGGGAAIGPAAAEGDVDAKAELAAFGLRVADVIEELGREEGEVLEALWLGRRGPAG